MRKRRLLKSTDDEKDGRRGCEERQKGREERRGQGDGAASGRGKKHSKTGGRGQERWMDRGQRGRARRQPSPSRST